MPRRKGKRHASELERFSVRVTATAVRVSREGPGILYRVPHGESDTTIHIEGSLDRPVLRMQSASIMVLSRAEDGDPGAAIGSTTIWQVVITLPRAQFADL